MVLFGAMSARLGSGGPPEGRNPEAEFHGRLREKLDVWQRRLGVAASVPEQAAAIGREAAELRAVARSAGWAGIEQHLEKVERVSRESPGALASAVRALAYRLVPASSSDAGRLAFGPSVPEPSSIVSGPPLLTDSLISPPRDRAATPPPPMLLDPNARAAGSSLPRGGQGTLVANAASEVKAANPPAPARFEPDAQIRGGSPIPDSIIKPATAPKMLVKSLLGFEAFGKKRSGATPVPADPSATPLGLVSWDDPSRKGRDRPTPNPSLPERFTPNVRGDRKTPSPPRPTPLPSRRPPAGGPRLSPPRSSGPRLAPGSVPRWFYLLAGALGVLAIATITTVIVSSRSGFTTSVDAGARARVMADSGPASVVEETVAAVHEHGPESPELRALIDAESRLVAKCRIDPATCRKRWIAHSIDPFDAGALVAAPSTGPRSAWLKQLKVPADFPLRDDPSVKGNFEYNGRNIAGRARFQKEMFRCSAYADIFDSTFVKYGAPTWLAAVVYQESACDPKATSTVGARGLWQFMPETARAYGLRVVEDDVDERLNPFKATEAGVRFLTDLQRKLGAWDLALAAYNMGPFAITARISQVGGHAEFWDLVRAGLLPDETSGYVPAIEAYALILENLVVLQFPIDGKRLEASSEISVKPGTRLTFVARAAHTSAAHIRELNLDFLREVVPDGEATIRVPDSEARRAQEFLNTRDQNDKTDLCVPDEFDWGAKVFEGSPFEKNCHNR